MSYSRSIGRYESGKIGGGNKTIHIERDGIAHGGQMMDNTRIFTRKFQGEAPL